MPAHVGCMCQQENALACTQQVSWVFPECVDSQHRRVVRARLRAHSRRYPGVGWSRELQQLDLLDCRGGDMNVVFFGPSPDDKQRWHPPNRTKPNNEKQ